MVTDNQIIKAYKETGNVWRAGELLGMKGGTVHYRLKKLGIETKNKKFTPDEKEVLKRRYVLYRDNGELEKLASEMGRTKQFLCRQAGLLGLTDSNYKRLWGGKWNHMQVDEAELLFEQFKKSRLGYNQFCEKHRLGKNGFYNTMKKFFPDEWEHVIELKTPKQSLYRLGRQVEYSVRDDFKKHGWPIALRSPASRSPVDITAIRAGVVALVQCKRSMDTLVEEWNKIYDLAESVGAIPLIAGRPTGRGLVYWLMLDRKDGTKRPQPKRVVIIDEIQNLLPQTPDGY